MRSPKDPDSGPKSRKAAGASGREGRLSAALKANMTRRKAQAKARGATDAPGENKSEG